MKYAIDHSKTSGNEYELDACFHWDYWALPISVYWWKHGDGLYNACLDVSLHIFCFSFHFEWWKWGKKGKENERPKAYRRIADSY